MGGACGFLARKRSEAVPNRVTAPLLILEFTNPPASLPVRLLDGWYWPGPGIFEAEFSLIWKTSIFFPIV